MFVTVALVYVFVAAIRRASASLRAEGEGADADDETRDILRQQKRTVARVVVASVVAIMSTFVAIGGGPMIYGYVRPNFWRKRSMVFLVTFIVDSVVNDLCLMAVAFVTSVWKSTRELG